jgi:hypothetical protein
MGWIEVESFETSETREIWMTFFDDDGWARHRVSWGADALSQPDFDVRRQIFGRLRHEGFAVQEAERLADGMSTDLQKD